MPSSVVPVPIPRGARFNPIPAERLPEVRPLPVMELDARASVASIVAKWDAMETQGRDDILHYFNTIPGKFTLTEAQITAYAQMEYSAIPNTMKDALRNAVVGWHWDRVLGDALPAAHIVLGLGGYTLSQAGELAIQTFSLMPEALRKKLVDGYSIWDGLKARGEQAVSGISIQGAISDASRRARRDFRAWRVAWEALTAEEKVLYFHSVPVYPNITHVHTTSLAGRPFNDLPDEVKAHLYDTQQVNEIAAKIGAGRVTYYTQSVAVRVIKSTTEAERWPNSRISDFIGLAEEAWNSLSDAGRQDILTFIKANDPYLFARHDAIDHTPSYIADTIPVLRGKRFYDLSQMVNGAALGHIALYFMWSRLRRVTSTETLNYLLIGLDAYNDIIPVSVAPRETPERITRIAGVMSWLDGVLRGVNEGLSYNQWILNSGREGGWITKLAHNSSNMTQLLSAGRTVFDRVAAVVALRARARFQVGQLVRVKGIANLCMVEEISTESRESVLYNIATQMPAGRPGDTSTTERILGVQEQKLSPWVPWSLQEVLSGALWNDNMGLSNRQWWLRRMNSSRLSHDVTGTAPVDIQAARTWEGLEAQFRTKLTILLVMTGFVEGFPWADYPESWRLMNADMRTVRILFAMSIKDPLDHPILAPSNEPHIFMAAQENGMFDLPLAYIYGIALSELGEEEELKHYKLAYENLHARYQAANEEDAIYYGIGAGIEPQIAVSTVRPVRYPIAKMTDWKAFKLVEAFKKLLAADDLWGRESERITAAFNTIVAAGRRATPELPRVSALDELNTAWGTAHYQDRYMVVVGAIGRDAVLEQYAGNGYQPPATYIQAASARDVNTIRDTVILQTLVREFEAASRNMAPLQQRGGETLRFIAESLNSARREGAEAAGDRTRAQWDALPNYLRAYVMKYARDEGLTTSAPRPTYGPWESMTSAEKAMLLNIPDWDLAKKYGAAKQLETLWAVGSAPARQHWILGLGTTILAAEFHAVMTSEWSEYSRIPARFTQALIEAMVSGIDGHYGPEALGILADRGTNIDPERMISSAVIPLGQVHVGDFVRVTAHGQAMYGFVVLKESELGDVVPARTPLAQHHSQLFGNWGDSFMEAYNQGAGITVDAVRDDMAGAERDMISGITEAEISGIVRYEQNYPLPILNDGWGRAPGGAAEASMLIRIGRLCGIMLLGSGDVPERLLAHLYPDARIASTTLYEHSIWSVFPPEMRSLLVWSQLHSELYERDERYLSTLVGELGRVQRVLLDDWLMALGGNVLVVQFRQSNIEDWLTIWLPILAFAYRKVMERASPPAGTRPLTLTLMDVPATVAPSRETIIGLPGIVPPTPVRPTPARPVRVMESTIRRAWAHSAPHERMAVLRAMGIPMGVARPFISTPFSHLTVALKNRIKRARREGVWEIRDSRMAVSARPTVPAVPATPTPAVSPTPAELGIGIGARRPVAPAAPLPTVIEAAWNGLDTIQRGAILTAFDFARTRIERLSSRGWSGISRLTQDELGRRFDAGEWGPQGLIPRTPRGLIPRTPPTVGTAWDGLTYAQRGRVLRSLHFAQRTLQFGISDIPHISVTTWLELSSGARSDLTAAYEEGQWGPSGPAVAIGPTPAVTPTPAPPARQCVLRTGRVSHLRRGDLVQYGLREDRRYGVIVHIGTYGEVAAPNAVWAIWRPTPEQALEAYIGMTTEQMRQAPAGELRWFAVQGPEHLVSVLERGIPSPSGLPTVPVKPPAPVPTPTPTAIMMRAWDALPPPRRVHVLQATVPEISTAQARTRSLMPFGVLDHETQSALQEALDQGLWIARGLRPVTPAPPPTPAPSGEEFFQDPFRQAIRATMDEAVREWPRAQLDFTRPELDGVATLTDVMPSLRRHVSLAGGHGVPVPFLLVALDAETIRSIESARPEAARLRNWQRIKGAVRHRGGQAVVSLQVGEFYKSGKWWRENSVQWSPKRKANPEAPKAHKGEVVSVYYALTGNSFAARLLKDPYFEDGVWKIAIRDRTDERCEAKWNGENFSIGGKENPFVFPSFTGAWKPNPEGAEFQMVLFRPDVYPIKVIDEFLQRHAEGWVTSFQRHYNLDRLPNNKRVYIAISTAPADKPKPLLDKIIGVLGVTQNRWDNIDDVFIAVHTGYRRLGVGKQMAAQLTEIARRWINPETGRGPRRIYLLVKDSNQPSNLMFTTAGYTRVEQYVSQAGETVNRYMKQLYDPPRENTGAPQ